MDTMILKSNRSTVPLWIVLTGLYLLSTALYWTNVSRLQAIASLSIVGVLAVFAIWEAIQERRARNRQKP